MLKAAVLQHFPFPSLGHLGEYLEQVGITYECTVYSDLPELANSMRNDADLIILLGSPASVNDDLPWVSHARKLVRDHLAKDRPIFGICFGAQLIASALGSEVVRLAEPRVGFRELGTGSNGAFCGNWLCFHEEHILPTPEMDQIMCNDGIMYAFKKGKAIGIQFHPEMDMKIISDINSIIGEEHPYHDKLKMALGEFDESTQSRSYHLFNGIISSISDGRSDT